MDICLPAHSSDSHSTQCQPGAQNTARTSQVGGRGSSTGAVTDASQGARRKLWQHSAMGTRIQDAGTLRGSCTKCVDCCPRLVAHLPGCFQVQAVLDWAVLDVPAQVFFTVNTEEHH